MRSSGWRATGRPTQVKSTVSVRVCFYFQERVTYICAPAHETGLPDSCADLVTVAQGIHWFDLDKFYKEARRILKPGGLLAFW